MTPGSAPELKGTPAIEESPATPARSFSFSSSSSFSFPQLLASLRTRLRRPALSLSMAVVALLTLSGALLLLLRRPVPGQGQEPATGNALAVLDVRNLTGSPGDAWLEEGLPQMIGAALFREGDIEVIPPERVREVRRRSGEGDGALSLGSALQLGRRLGAGLMVRGGFSHGQDRYILDLTLYDASGKVLQLFTVEDRSLLALADAAAARLAALAGGSPPSGPVIAGAETSSLEAYRHYIRALQAGDEGRYGEARAEVDAALAEDSQFVAALRLKGSMASESGDARTDSAAIVAILRAGDRASPFDRLDVSAHQALIEGQHERAELLARELVRRFPRDPRAYRTLAEVLFAHGRFAALDSAMQRALALDSLGMEAGRGPCMPCVGYGGLSSVRLLRGDAPGAIAAARRWVQLEPDVPSAWAHLASALSMAGDFDAAITAQRRVVALDPGVGSRAGLARILLMAGRFAPVDSIVADWERSRDPEARETALDLRATVERERGQFVAAAATLAPTQHGSGGGLALVAASNLARIGERARAYSIYERAGHITSGTESQQARGYCWAHALEAADAVAAGDTARARALADSIASVARASYYARDWRLAADIRGLLALRARRFADAERDLGAARFGTAGWTATNLALAQAQVAQGKANAAVMTLEQALAGPLDGMGRYVPRTELEYALARAFAAAGRPDSARAWATRVRAAWAHADPDLRARLATLP